MKECDILGESKHTLIPATYSQVIKTPTPTPLAEGTILETPQVSTGAIYPRLGLEYEIRSYS